jgi:endonuclease/exonuclease/phosphatase family metal-dependent hydrolase
VVIRRRYAPPLRRPRRFAVRTEPIIELDAPVGDVEHDFGDELSRWGGFRHRSQLRRDPAFMRRRHEIDAVLSGYEWDLRATRPPGSVGPVRAVAWNIERGKRLEPLLGVLAEREEVANPDLVLLTEVDVGMGRSRNEHVARRIGEALGLGWIFAPSHLVLAPGDHAELDHGIPNTRSLHGVTLLSRFPVRRVVGVSLPEYVDKFHTLEKRLGDKRALVAEVDAPGGPIAVASVHLDPFCPPRHRARQMRLVTAAIERMGCHRALLGGDLNTNTYHLGSVAGLGIDIAHKLLRFGFEETVRQYMTPEQVFERSVFGVLAKAGLTIEGFNQRETATLYYDINDPELIDKSRDYLPAPMLRWLTRKLEPWSGCVPLRMDWFAGRGLRPLRSSVLERPRYQGGHVSDHDPVIVDFEA